MALFKHSKMIRRECELDLEILDPGTGLAALGNLVKILTRLLEGLWFWSLILTVIYGMHIF